jgi:poly-gamma-glutamate synthesis protein (capsule biosynthesis protein)
MSFIKSKLFWILFLSLLLLAIFSAFLYNSYRSQIIDFAGLFNEPRSLVENEPVYEFKRSIYFVLTTNIRSEKLNATLNELQNSKVIAIESDKEKIQKVEVISNSDINVEFVSNIEDVNNSLNNNFADFAIIKFEDINTRIKALSFENQNLLTKAPDLENYSLSYTETLLSNSPVEDQSNFNPEMLQIVGHTGSIIAARGAQYTAEKRYNNDYTKLFESTKKIFDQMDFVSATMEAPVKGNGRECNSCTNFLGPEKIMEGIKYSGIDLLSTAANHIMDAGVDGLSHTQKLISEAEILQTGASTINNDDASKPVLAEVNGVKIAYLAFNDTPGRNQWAGENSPGAANISDWIVDGNGRTIKYEPNEERIEYFMQRAKDLNPDLIFVIMHWGGQEYAQRPLPYTRTLAQLLVKYGADAILGDHPHWVQEMEFIDDVPVWYCVGNFIFDQTWSEETMQGLSIEMNIYNGKIINFKLHPHYAKVQGVPVLLEPTDPKYKVILNRVWDVSEV